MTFYTSDIIIEGIRYAEKKYPEAIIFGATYAEHPKSVIIYGGCSSSEWTNSKSIGDYVLTIIRVSDLRKQE